MTADKSDPENYQADPAAVFASAMSLWLACHQETEGEQRINLSESYNGMDQFMREVMRVAELFEAWACRHVAFAELNDVWPYLLQDKFGGACVEMIFPDALTHFDDTDCLRIALRLQLPVNLDDQLPIPVDVQSPNPASGSGFRAYRIQTVRNPIDDDDVVPFSAGDEPFDPEFFPPYFGLYGIGDDGLMEHIADRKSYAEALDLAQKIAPGVTFPSAPIFGAT